jgi:glycine/D-amino acid oxidase-like deaminating enzyme
MKKALVIGGGFAGCASVHQLLLMGNWDVTLVEAAPFLGAGRKEQFVQVIAGRWLDLTLGAHGRARLRARVGKLCADRRRRGRVGR